MKICWDNLEKIRYVKQTGNFRGLSKRSLYYYEDCCLECGEPFLKAKKHFNFCSKECMFKSKSYKDKQRISSIKSSGPIGKSGDDNHMWKGGYRINHIPSYDTYASQLEPIEQCRRNADDSNILEVKCTYCGKWHMPSYNAVKSRIDAINGKLSSGSELRLYCSPSCKKECPIYYQKTHYKSDKKVTSREVQPELRQLVFARDNWTCQKCGDNSSLHCHHIEPVISNPIESADIDVCITLCKQCHKEVHKQEGCSYYELKDCYGKS